MDGTMKEEKPMNTIIITQFSNSNIRELLENYEE